MDYLHNANGERVYRTGGGQTVLTVYDEAGHWLGDYDGNGQPLQQAIWLDDLPVSLLVGAGAQQRLYYLEPDALGSPRVAIDPDRDVAVWTWDLAGEAFGEGAPHQDPDGDSIAFVLDLRYPGQRYDAATGLNENYHRDYDPVVGRYAQSDPIGLAGGTSTYGYVEGGPLGGIDPLGLRRTDVGSIIKGVMTKLGGPKLARSLAGAVARKAARKAAYEQRLAVAVRARFARWMRAGKVEAPGCGNVANSTKPVVTARLTVGGAFFEDVNQTARVGRNVEQPTLIADRVLAKELESGRAFPNGNMATAHAEIGALQQAFDAGASSSGRATLIVTGEPVCGYCRGDIAAMAQRANLLYLEIFEEATGATFYWLPGMRSIRKSP
ncbi:MAG: cytidine deaminase-like fold-containing protein [Pseudomonadota bacterium]